MSRTLLKGVRAGRLEGFVPILLKVQPADGLLLHEATTAILPRHRVGTSTIESIRREMRRSIVRCDHL